MKLARTYGQSMPCAKCGGATGVKDTRPTKFLEYKGLRRRRYCTVCEHRWTTVELDVEIIDAAEQALGPTLRGLRSMHAMIDTVIDAINKAKGNAEP